MLQRLAVNAGLALAPALTPKRHMLSVRGLIPALKILNTHGERRRNSKSAALVRERQIRELDDLAC